MNKDAEALYETLCIYARAIGYSLKPYAIISHPLISNNVISENNTMIIINEFNFKEYIEKLLLQIKNRCKTVLQILCYINKPYRLQILISSRKYLSKKTYSKNLGWVWANTEYPHQIKTRELINAFKDADCKIINKKDFNQLPETLTVYRGLQGSKAKLRGLSWTLNLKIATWFANRFKLQGKVYSAQIKKKDIFFYSNERNEQECVLNPYKLKNITEVKQND
jgi:hypothetical protein